MSGTNLKFELGQLFRPRTQTRIEMTQNFRLILYSDLHVMYYVIQASMDVRLTQYVILEE